MNQKAQRKALLLAASFGLIGVTGSEVISAMEPGKPEPKLQTAAAGDDQATGETKPAGKVPSSNPLSGDPEAIDLGKRLYFTWCVQCHGPKANGESRFGKYAGNLTIFWRGYKEFVVIVKIGAYLETVAVEGANWK